MQFDQIHTHMTYHTANLLAKSGRLSIIKVYHSYYATMHIEFVHMHSH